MCNNYGARINYNVGNVGRSWGPISFCDITIWVIYSITSQIPPVATFWKGAFTRVTSENTGAREKMQRFAAAKFFERTTKRVIYVFTSRSWDLMGFHNAYVAIVRSAFSNLNVFSRIFKATFTVTTPSFEEKLRNHRPSSLVVRHSGIFRRQAALWASSAHWATDGVSGAENKPLGRWNWIGFNWLLCYWWEIKVNGICF